MEDLGDILRRLATRDTSADNPYASGPAPDDGAAPCERCDGRGWITADVPVGHPEFGRVVICDCQEERVQEERYTRLLRYSNLSLLTRFTFETLKPEGVDDDPRSRTMFEAAYKAAAEFAESPRGWLVLSGPNGSGKTHLAAAIGNRLIERGHVAFFAHMPDLMDHLRATFSPTSDIAYSELFDQVKSTPVLILDDLSARSPTPWAEEKLRQIVNHRYGAGLPTVFTTAGAVEELDPYIRGRVRTAEEAQLLELPGPEWARSRMPGGIDRAMLQRMTLDSFEPRGNNPTADQRASLEGALTAARNFAADPDGWLALYGDTGVGKTHLAIAIAAEQLKQERSVRFAFVPELMDNLRYTFDPDSPVSPDNFFEDIKNARLLILDDLGQERSSPWANDKLYQIIVHRYNLRLPTVITSMMDFAADAGPVASRVRDPLLCQLIKIDAPDYRSRRRPPGRRRSKGGG